MVSSWSAWVGMRHVGQGPELLLETEDGRGICVLQSLEGHRHATLLIQRTVDDSHPTTAEARFRCDSHPAVAGSRQLRRVRRQRPMSDARPVGWSGASALGVSQSSRSRNTSEITLGVLGHQAAYSAGVGCSPKRRRVVVPRPRGRGARQGGTPRRSGRGPPPILGGSGPASHAASNRSQIRSTWSSTSRGRAVRSGVLLGSSLMRSRPPVSPAPAGSARACRRRSAGCTRVDRRFPRWSIPPSAAAATRRGTHRGAPPGGGGTRRRTLRRTRVSARPRRGTFQFPFERSGVDLRPAMLLIFPPPRF